MYQKLVSDPEDAVGMFAYIAYKRHKVEFRLSLNGREPTQQELDDFHAFASLATSIASYRAQAAKLMTTLMSNALSELACDAKSEARQSVVYQQIEVVNAGLMGKLNLIDSALQAKRTFAGWLRDIAGNLVVNLVTVGFPAKK